MRISNLFNRLKQSLCNSEEDYKIAHVFNCKDIIWITPCKVSQETPEVYSHCFFIFFNSGFKVMVSVSTGSKETPSTLSDIRELFINNIGFSYLQLDENQVRGLGFSFNKNIYL